MTVSEKFAFAFPAKLVVALRTLHVRTPSVLLDQYSTLKIGAGFRVEDFPEVVHEVTEIYFVEISDLCAVIPF